MKILKSSKTLLSLALFLGLVGCAAVKVELAKSAELAKADEEIGWKIQRNPNIAFDAAHQFLKKKTGVTPSSQATHQGPFGGERKYYTDKQNKDVYYAFFLRGHRLNHGMLPDQKKCQLRKILYEKKIGDEWVSASEKEIEALAAEFKTYAEKFNSK